jgi:spore coat protein CotH
VTPQPDAPLYDAQVLRTLFLDFVESDWEKELADFHGTDVDVAASLTVDGKTYPNVGVRFRGMSSYMGVGDGSKRSLNVSLDFGDSNQRLYGYKTLNLLNAHEDPTFMHTVLYSHLARKFIPAPKANLVKVVINGESWGVYVNVQQFDKIFLEENYHDTKGSRWKVRGSPGGGGGLDFVGEETENYKRRYEIKSGDNEKAWKQLIELCRTLGETPAETLEQSLEPMLDIDAALWFLALDNALINCDGYWIRASDYSLFCDENGRFHIIPHDMNEAFQAPMGPGMGRGGPNRQAAGSNPFALDPLIGLDDKRKPLRSRLLSAPELRTRYLDHVRAIADELDWKKLGPVVEQYRSLIEKELDADTRKLTSFAAFQNSLTEPKKDAASRDTRHNLPSFARQRREYLTHYREAVH